MPVVRCSTRARYGAAILVALLCSACSTFACSSAPTLNGVVPGTGYPRQLLAVDGMTGGAAVVWDVGSASEVELTTGLIGTQYFQIPASAKAGSHMVALRNAAGTSNAVTVTVLPAAPFPGPRPEDAVVVSMTPSGTGTMDVLLAVSAANLDVDAMMTVDERRGTDLARRMSGPSILWGGLPIDYQQAHDPATFEYPVYHYAQQLVPVADVTPGATLHVTMTNTDGATKTIDVAIPASEEDLDSDGDGLLNAWEEKGYEAPSGATISLSDLGTNVWRKDILIEVDQISKIPIHADLWTAVEAAFRDAPVLNADGSAGMTVIIDRGQGGVFTNGGQELPDHDCLTLDYPAPPPPSSCTDLRSFYEFKNEYFDADRLNIFHYAVWGNKLDTLSSGDGERWGNDFAITLGFSNGAMTLPLQLGTFVHELGHNLSLTHGNLFDNSENYDFKPNLPSVMNYRYQASGVDLDCDLVGNGVYTYSQGTLRMLSELSVNENIGVCDNKPANLDMNPAITSGPANLNWIPVTGSDMDTNDDWHDFDQWGHIRLNFTSAGSNWDND